jgi:hypothetical protein
VIIGSIGGILAATALVVAGVITGTQALSYGSIAMSVLSAVALVAGVRAGAKTASGDDTRDLSPGQVRPDDGQIPLDEPAEQELGRGPRASLARLAVPVLVIDGRPRFHVEGCLHLLGRRTEPLPVMEAVQLGFTACGDCQPGTALLAAAHRS